MKSWLVQNRYKGCQYGLHYSCSFIPAVRFYVSPSELQLGPLPRQSPTNRGYVMKYRAALLWASLALRFLGLRQQQQICLSLGPSLSLSPPSVALLTNCMMRQYAVDRKRSSTIQYGGTQGSWANRGLMSGSRASCILIFVTGHIGL